MAQLIFNFSLIGKKRLSRRISVPLLERSWTRKNNFFE